MNAPATHTGLLYNGSRQYAAEAGGFLRDGLERGNRGLVMAPPARIDVLRSELGVDADEVTWIEDAVAYAPQWNAYRVLLDFAATAPDARSTVVAEQSLSTRLPAEVHDYRRLEVAANIVFADLPFDLLCPYDTGALSADLLDIALGAHDAVRVGGETESNDRYDDPLQQLMDLATVVAPPRGATTLDLLGTSDVAVARRLVRLRGDEVGLDGDVVEDMALAVTEVLTNALVHGSPPAMLYLYDDGATWVCHVQDGGRGPLDPLTGLLPPHGPSDHGYGLWLARQLCAAVDVGNDASGTHVRLHART